MNPRYRWLLLFLGLAMIAVAMRIALLDEPVRRIPEFLVLFFLFFAVYCGAIFVLSRVTISTTKLVAFVIGVAVLCRLVFLVQTPSLSTDIYRYLWEGRVIAAGHNPFAIAPQAPELEPLRDKNFEGVSHKHMQTIYPPLSQALFFLGAVVHPSLTTLKAIFVIFDLATLAIIILLLRAKRRQLAMCAVYAWSPLVILEISHSGHLDSVGIFFLVLAVYLFEKRRAFAVTSALALSFLAKFFAILLTPFFLFKKRHVTWLVPFVLIAVIGFLPFAGAGDKLFSSLGTYSRHWEFNSALFSLATRIFGHPHWIRILFFGAVVVYSVVQGYRRSSFIEYVRRVIALALLLAPTFYPWYLCWLIPFLVFSPKRSWMYLSGAAVLSYWVWVRFENTGIWDPGPVVMAVEWVPFFTLLAVEMVQSRVRRGGDQV
ncbi:MAG: hypothetical protein JSW50_10125 [Candidatus Latescibacterota bacterium]|nr:MAG: hypothetical protein JSW50_10125 [Candidatus Latescibacterota bacterium]